MKSTQKVRQTVKRLACGGIFALMQAGTALAADEKSGFTITRAFNSFIAGISPTLQDAFSYAYENISSAAWGALVFGILLLVIKAGLSHVGTDTNPSDAAKHESAIVGVLRVAGVALLAVGVIYMLHQKFA